jgi:hypothetical protein
VQIVLKQRHQIFTQLLSEHKSNSALKIVLLMNSPHLDRNKCASTQAVLISKCSLYAVLWGNVVKVLGFKKCPFQKTLLAEKSFKNNTNKNGSNDTLKKSQNLRHQVAITYQWQPFFPLRWPLYPGLPYCSCITACDTINSTTVIVCRFVCWL